MRELPETRDSLIARVRDHADGQAWAEFVEIYRPVVYRLARKRGLQDADAQDLAQHVLVAVSGAVGRWQSDGQPGRFGAWLMTIARNAIINALTRRPRDRAGGGTTAAALLQEHADPGDLSAEAVETEYRRELFRRAARIVRDDVDEATWQAFALTTIEGVAIEDAAIALGKSAGSVYAARSRVMRRLRDAVRSLEEWTP